MKRDMDLIRNIVLDAEGLLPDTTISGMEGVDPRIFALHVRWMEEAGLVKAKYLGSTEGVPTAAMLLRLTWEGCEFADAVRDDTIWKKARDKVLRPGMSFTFDVLKDWLKAEIREGFPALRGLGQ